jgi:Asp-tRNA(Asn)/Glu-tRNA(Gln) amidotransferase A subunit family amidase
MSRPTAKPLFLTIVRQVSFYSYCLADDRVSWAHFSERTFESSARFGGIYIHNASPFNVWGTRTISVPCGFTRKGMPVGLQISGPNGGEAVVLQLAHAYEQATDWHRRAPEMKA